MLKATQVPHIRKRHGTYARLIIKCTCTAVITQLLWNSNLCRTSLAFAEPRRLNARVELLARSDLKGECNRSIQCMV